MPRRAAAAGISARYGIRVRRAARARELVALKRHLPSRLPCRRCRSPALLALPFGPSVLVARPVSPKDLAIARLSREALGRFSDFHERHRTSPPPAAVAAQAARFRSRHNTKPTMSTNNPEIPAEEMSRSRPAAPCRAGSAISADPAVVRHHGMRSINAVKKKKNSPARSLCRST